jgi:hypothetical protein
LLLVGLGCFGLLLVALLFSAGCVWYISKSETINFFLKQDFFVQIYLTKIKKIKKNKKK